MEMELDEDTVPDRGRWIRLELRDKVRGRQGEKERQSEMEMQMDLELEKEMR